MQFKQTQTIFYSLFIAFFCHPSVAFASGCFPQQFQKESGADFFDFTVATIERLKESHIKQNAAFNKKGGGANWAADIMVALKEDVEVVQCEGQKAQQFFDSTVEVIADSSKGIAAALKGLQQQDESMISDFKASLDGTKKPLGAGAQAESDADRQLTSHKNWELFLVSFSGATHAVLTFKDNKSYLNLTKQQKQDFLKRLKPLLPKKGSKVNHALDVSAKALENFLNQKWKLVGEK